jgi:hypothetical protein
MDTLWWAKTAAYVSGLSILAPILIAAPQSYWK